MVAGFNLRAKDLLVGALLAGSLLAPPSSPARAETAAHKLKKRLHKVEHTTGAVLCRVGQVLGEGVALTVEAYFDSLDDADSPSPSAAPLSLTPEPRTAHHAQPSSHSRPAHSAEPKAKAPVPSVQ